METTSNNYSKNFKLPLDNYKMDMFENQTSVFSKPPHRKVSSPHDELGEQDATPLLARVAFDSYRRNILEKFSLGYTKNLQRKIAFHAKLQPDNCKFFKAFVVENPKVSAAYLEKILDAWLLEYGSVPPGNSTQRHLWEGRKPRQEVGQDNNNNNRKTTTTFRVNDFFDGKDSFSLGSKVTKNVEYDDYLQTWIPVATVVGLSVLLWLMSLVTTSLQPDTLGL